MQAVFFDIRKYSLHDGPGIRTVVFFKGCPLRCTWCHNPEGQRLAQELVLRENRCIRCEACLPACPNGAIHLDDAGGVVTDRQLCRACGECVESCYAEARQLAGRRLGLVEVLAEIEADRAFYAESGGGVTFSGGEPLMQPEFLLAILQACRSSGLHTALDTCGFAPWESLEAVRAWVDLFLYDIKLVDGERHRQATGVDNAQILRNLRRLSALGQRLILRFPLIPGLNDDPENLQAVAALAASLPHLERVDLLPYHHSAQGKYASLGRAYPLPDVHPPPPGEVKEAVRMFESYSLNVKIGG